MSDVVQGFKNQTWLIIEYDGSKEISQERIPRSEASEMQIIELLQKRSGEMPQKDLDNGNRLIYMAGQNPHYVASLWRADELEERDLRDA